MAAAENNFVQEGAVWRCRLCSKIYYFELNMVKMVQHYRYCFTKQATAKPFKLAPPTKEKTSSKTPLKSPRMKSAKLTSSHTSPTKKSPKPKSSVRSKSTPTSVALAKRKSAHTKSLTRVQSTTVPTTPSKLQPACGRSPSHESQPARVRSPSPIIDTSGNISSPISTVTTTPSATSTIPKAGPAKAHSAPAKGHPAGDTGATHPPPKLLVGDMFWGKVSGHPWWPCMVSFDPFEGRYYRPYIKGKCFSYSYHVQYFGNEGERGWLTEASLVAYCSLEEFKDFCAEKQKNNKVKALKDRYKIAVPKPKQAAWQAAIKYANEAAVMDRNHRKQKCTFEYKSPKKKKLEATSKPASCISVCDMSNAKKDSKKRCRSMSVGVEEGSKTGTDAGAPPTDEPPMKKMRKVKTVMGSMDIEREMQAFVRFCSEQRPKVRQINPRLGRAEVEIKLKVMWIGLTQEQQSKYKTLSLVEEKPDKPLANDLANHSSAVNSDECKKSCEDGAISADTSGGNTPTDADSRKKARRQSKPTRKILESAQQLFTQTRPHGLVRDSVQHKQAAQEGTSSKQPEDKAISDNNTSATECTNDETTVKKKKVRVPYQPEGYTEGQIELERLAITGPTGKERMCEICEECEDLDDIITTSDTTPSTSTAMTTTAGQQQQPLSSSSSLPTGAVATTASNASSSSASKMVTCVGKCQSSFHITCLGIKVLPPSSQGFMCDRCTTGTHPCFLCKLDHGVLQRCKSPQCYKWYHMECIRKLHNATVDSRNNIHCPLHVCATCKHEDLQQKANKGRLLRCIRCPTAYHTGELCVAAGSIVLSSNYIICSKHFSPKKSNSHHARLNVSWCFECSKGGTLVCCDSCPASYHADCADIKEPDAKSWYCKDCTTGKQPLYGDIVWVKIGNYRWWPCEIRHPDNIPINIRNMPHAVGEFPVYFYGTHEYFWSNKGRVFHYHDTDLEGKEGANTTLGSARSLAQSFKKATEEVVVAFLKYRIIKEKMEHNEQQKVDKKPPPYKHIKTNVPIGNVQIYKADPAELPICECSSNMSAAPCTTQADCINAMLMYECHPQTCPAGVACSNQRFQKRLYPASEVVRTKDMGWALVAKTDIRKGDFVNEYVGDLIDDEECKRRIATAHERNITNFYMLTLDSKRVIDAGPKGNYSRFMNHSCQPNCETQKWTINGDIRVGLFAICDIKAGDPLTFNYQFECRGAEKTVCRCGAPNCSGFLGVRPKNLNCNGSEGEKKVKREKKKKKRKTIPESEVKIHEDDCFRCGEGGELVLCDKPKCPKVYHLSCLNLSKLPHGKWMCCWHHCDDCGRRSTKLCSECPNSFCNQHLLGNIYRVSADGRFLCSDHTSMLTVMLHTQVEVDTPCAPEQYTPSMMSSAAPSIPSELSSVVSSAVSASSTPRHTDTADEDDTPVVSPPSVSISALLAQLDNATSTDTTSDTDGALPDCSTKDRKSKGKKPARKSSSKRDSTTPQGKVDIPTTATQGIDTSDCGSTSTAASKEA